MNSITINGVEYVRADLTVKPLDIGEKRIVAAEGGWVFVGDCTDEADGTVTIRNAKNIRRWGTTAGLGQLWPGVWLCSGVARILPPPLPSTSNI